MDRLREAMLNDLLEKVREPADFPAMGRGNLIERVRDLENAVELLLEKSAELEAAARKLAEGMMADGEKR